MRHGSQYRVGVLVAFPVFPSSPITVSWPTVCPPQKKKIHKALLQMHILVQFPFGPQYNNHVPYDIIEPTAVEHHTSDRRPHFGPFLSEDIHSMMRRTIHAMGPRMPPERMMVIAVRSPARHLIPLRNNQTYHKQRCGSDKDILIHFFI